MFTLPASVRLGLGGVLLLSAAGVWAQMSPLEGDGVAGEVPDWAAALEGDDAGAAIAEEAAVTEAPAIRCGGDGPCIEEATGLPLQVLPRPFSNIYAESTADPQAVVSANVPAFRPLYVFERLDVDLSDAADPRGWYQVGTNRNQAAGWMQAKDALEWRQALLVAYTHPGDVAEGRRPVLMFRELAALRGIVDADDMAGDAQSLYDKLDGGEVPADVVSMEPKRFIDINRQFYVLPILDWQTVDLYGDEVRLLQLAAAVPGARGADTLDEGEYAAQAAVGRGEDQGAGLEALTADIVFVMDTTRSMQPYIDMTKEAVSKIVQAADERLSDRVRFGIVGYRDALEVAPKLEYTAKSFTPDLVSGAALLELLSGEVKATPVGSHDYAEEVFAGVDTALRTRWRDGAMRFVILVGDASGHPRGHAQNTTGKDETDLRRELADAEVHLVSLHLQDERAAEDHDLARTQFGYLASVRGSEDEQALIEADAFKREDFQAAADQVVNALFFSLDYTVTYKALPPPPPMPEFGSEGERQAAEQAQQAVGKVWQAALIEYLGKGAKPPKDIIAWAADRDLTNPADESLEVRVLITREQLSSLVQALDRVVQAMRKAEMSQGQFFEALQSVSGQTLKRPEELGKAATLADSGLLPSFIKSLPYRSDILSLTDEMYASLTAEQRVQLEWSVQAKLAQYRAINEQVDAWHRLNEADPDSDKVHPLHIDYLP